jgi:hypothetical protein
MKRKKRIQKRTHPTNKKFHGQLLFLIFSLSFFIVISMYTYDYYKPLNITALPLIKNNIKIYKIKPQQKSGLIFSHQNKTIYNNIAPKNNKIQNVNNAIPKIESDLLIVLRSNYLMIDKKDDGIASPFSILTEQQDRNLFLISFGVTSTKESAEVKMRRLVKIYKELAKEKFKIIKKKDDTYELRLADGIPELKAQSLFAKMRETKEVYDVKLSKY